MEQPVDGISRADVVYFAKLAEQAKRYDEMVSSMQKIAKSNVDLTLEERNLLSVAYQNLIGSRRNPWINISSSEEKEQTDTSGNISVLKSYRAKLEKELGEICADVLSLLDNHLIKNAQNGESEVFYYKMKGDYCRYTVEFEAIEKRKEAAQNALLAYQRATAIAEKELPPTNPVRLGLALNFSNFYYDILNEPNRACILARTAFDNALAELEWIPENSYKDATLIMRLLRESLSDWQNEMLLANAKKFTTLPRALAPLNQQKEAERASPEAAAEKEKKEMAKRPMEETELAEGKENEEKETKKAKL